MTPARFIACYNALGIRFELRNGVASALGGSPVFCEWVREHSAWLAPWLGVQSAVRVQVEQLSVKAESTHADELIWAGIENARKAEAKVKAIVRSKYK